MTDIVWNPLQTQALEASGSVVVLGPAGSGKSTMLVQKAARLVASGVNPQHIALATFAFRTLQSLKEEAKQQLGAQAASLTTGTLKDLATAQLMAAGQKVDFASNNAVRRYIRVVMAQQNIECTLSEAEHVLRTLKSRAKKVAENDRLFPFFNAYKTLLEGRGQLDRHDILRQHILGMRNNTVPPTPVRYLLVDNLQDATEIQLIWLKHHAAAGITLMLAGNDDITAYAPDGALGPQAFEQVGQWEGMQQITLSATYRTPANLAPSIEKMARMLRERCDKPESPQNKAEGTLTIESFPTAQAEHAWLLAEAKKAEHAGEQLGILTRTHTTAAMLTHVLQKGGVNPASYARLVWEEPTPQTVLALLYVLLNRASDTQLRLVLLGYGLPADAVNDLFAAGMNATDWLPNGCPFPPMTDPSPTVVATINKLRRNLGGAWQLMQNRVLDPRVVFKAAMADMLPTLPAEDNAIAVLATDMLLSLTGRLAEVLPRVMQETLPNMASPVIVAPVKEARNLAFTKVIIPYAQVGEWPRTDQKLLPANPEHERRLFVLALTRSNAHIALSGHGTSSPLVEELKQILAKSSRR